MKMRSITYTDNRKLIRESPSFAAPCSYWQVYLFQEFLQVTPPTGRVRLLTAAARIRWSIKPQRIVSTSVTLTGSLLAIDAPVIASGATTPNNRIGDAQGFYASGAKWQKNAN